MDWQIIISQNENLNEVYQSFGRDMKKYLESMNNSVADINAAVTSLGNSWKGNDYADFRRSMTEAMNKISSSLTRGESLRGAMDEAQQKLALGLEKLRKKYGSDR